MSSTVFLGRDNRIRLQLQQDGQTVQEGAVQRAVLKLLNSGVVFDTDSDNDITIESNGTEVVVQGGTREIPPKIYAGLLTVYDQPNPNGIAWAEVTLRVRDWPAE